MAGGINEQVLTAEERQVLTRICNDVGIPAEIVEQMILLEHRVYGMGRRHGLWESLEALVSQGLKLQAEENVA